MSENIHKSHNVSKLMYHFVLPTKYRRVVVSDEVENVIKETCIEISKRYEMYFLEIGADKDHVHFLIQSVPNYSPTQIIKIVKSITAKEVFARCPEVKKQLWGGNFWTAGYYVSTVSEHGNEEVIANYVKNQGNEYKKLFRNKEPEGEISILYVEGETVMPAYPAFGLAKQEQKASAVSGRRRSPSTVLECLHRGS